MGVGRGMGMKRLDYGSTGTASATKAFPKGGSVVIVSFHYDNIRIGIK